MAKSETVVTAKKRTKKPKSILVFDIIFIVLAILLVIGALFIFTPRNKVLTSLPKSWVTNLYNWVTWHVLKPFKRTRQVGGPNGVLSQGYTAAFFLFIIAFCLVFLFYLLYQPFVVLASNTAKGKTQKYRKVLCWVTFIVNLIATLRLVSLLYQYRCEKIFGAAYSWWPKFFNRIANSLQNGKLSVINLSFISINGAFNAFAWAAIARVVFEIIRLLIAGCGKAVEVAPAAVEEVKEAEKAVEEVPEEAPVEEPEAKPVMAEEKAPEVKPHEVMYPTVRDLELLASLEPIHISD